MEKYIPKFKEASFKKNIAGMVMKKYEEYLPFYKRDFDGLVDAISEDLHLNVNEVEYYLDRLGLM